MASDTRPKVILFGAGGVGAVYLYLLSKVSSVTAVCRSNYDKVKKDGFILNSSIFGQNLHFRPNVVRSCAEAAALHAEQFDYVIVCSKAIPGTTPKLIAPAVTPGHTIVVLIQNGIGIEEEYAREFPTNAIVSCVVYLPATQRPAGIVKHGEVELLEVGSYPATASSVQAEVFSKLVQAAGGTAEVYEDIQWKRWFKLVINASWNPVCALTLCKDAEFLQASTLAADFIYSVMLEVVAIARAYGHDIPQEKVDFQLNRAKARVPNAGVEPSMLQDVRAGRKMESEAIIGNAIRMAKEKAVSCDKLQTLYVLMTALNAAVAAKEAS
ncbi:ketopantoate reductase PanE/ApbA C terminal-domain-containing protein [Lophiotrema nucula]|uniref:2-dehydropantoate 2-reductase n=1 Tax=Lophiotrema nucula TaxID=690887 RepID=A0A6A5Z8A9_9PLEO|nr:ketopantoate reductase PanE/ApbA C terminal-domain-containing protein [Lophiotrema nucula]